MRILCAAAVLSLILTTMSQAQTQGVPAYPAGYHAVQKSVTPDYMVLALAGGWLSGLFSGR